MINAYHRVSVLLIATSIFSWLYFLFLERIEFRFLDENRLPRGEFTSTAASMLGSTITIAEIITLFGMLGALVGIVFGWRQDQKQALKSKLRISDLELKVQDIERRLSQDQYDQ